jgi:hypothetical protein
VPVYFAIDLGSAIYLQSLIVNFTRFMHFYKSGMKFALLYFAVVGSGRVGSGRLFDNLSIGVVNDLRVIPEQTSIGRIVRPTAQRQAKQGEYA